VVLQFQPLEPVTLDPGKDNALQVRLQRQNYDGRITLQAEGLPDGVEAEGGEVQPGSSVGSLQLKATASAAPTECLVRLVAEANGTRTEIPFRLTVGPPLPPKIVNSVGLELALIPAGWFVMGSPNTETGRADDEEQHGSVSITRPFYLGVCEVTHQQYQTVMGKKANPNASQAGETEPDNAPLPVVSVTWTEAQKFCILLSDKPKEKEAGHVYRLPTEAEWEFACRAGTNTAFSWGTSLSSDQASFKSDEPYGGGKAEKPRGKPRPVGDFPANAWGLRDMHGNVWEWCSDWYDPDFPTRRPAKDPQGPDQGKRRALRGGSWATEGKRCRAACRWCLEPNNSQTDIGFRVVLVVGAKKR
jgi:formylglycine-generating enzyme required for sulfatase activity